MEERPAKRVLRIIRSLLEWEVVDGFVPSQWITGSEVECRVRQSDIETVRRVAYACAKRKRNARIPSQESVVLGVVKNVEAVCLVLYETKSWLEGLAGRDRQPDLSHEGIEGSDYGFREKSFRSQGYGFNTQEDRSICVCP